MGTGEIYYITRDAWLNFLKGVAQDHYLLAPQEGLYGLEYFAASHEDVDKIVFPGARLTQPLKSFLYPPKESVTSEEASSGRKNIVLEAKACDLKAISILDKIFLDPEIVDPFYKTHRHNTIIITGDCSEPLDCCFCTLLEGNPFPETGFDLNISPVDDGVLVEVGSEKGKDLLEKLGVKMAPAEEKYVNLRRENRNKAIEKLREINKEFKFPTENLPALLAERYDSPAWEEACETCVRCGACTNICPSCHCFLLSQVVPAERKAEEKFEMIRTWDSCQYTGFARVAGGANPRKTLEKTFANRFHCKFEYKPENFGMFACTGCGRCYQACQGKIDVRDVLTKLASPLAVSESR